MDKTKKKRIKRIVTAVAVLLVVALLAAMPLIAKQTPEEDGPKASILSGTVSCSSIDTKLIGGGTLAEDDGVTVEVPSTVKLKKFLVANGDTVTKGTAIAAVDRVTVMTAITQVQETLEYLSEQIEEAGDTDGEETVTALAGGTVKILYAQEGDSVQSVVAQHGALAVLSLDGLMAADLETESKLPAGTAVKVTVANGKTVTGKIAKNLAGEMTVTVEDKDYAVDEPVQVTAEDGTVIGSGALYIYSPWNATAYAGTVSSIKVSVGDKLSPGKTLIKLRDVGYSAAYRQMISQRQKYEALMLTLFEMYQTETVTAPCDGSVSGIDKESVQLLSDNGEGYTLQLLANAPNGNDETLYTNYVGKVTAVAQSGWSLLVNPQPVAIADYTDLSGVPLDEKAMTRLCIYPDTPEEDTDTPAVPEDTAPEEETEAPPPAQKPDTPQLQTVPVYELANGAWQQIPFSSVSAGDIMLFAADQSGAFVWIVRIQKSGSGSSAPGGNFPSGGMTGGMSGGFPSGGTTPQEPAFEVYSLDMAQVAAVTPQNTMTLDITVDELDVLSLQVGMTAQVKINALGGEKHTATITEIGNSGTNNGGSSKYTVELTMDRAESMLSGMNATASIVLSTAKDVLTIPLAALAETGNQTVVYTGYNEKNETLLNPVVVTVGNTDGEYVEILDGLADGQTYYYAYYDTLELSVTPDFGGGLFGR